MIDESDPVRGHSSGPALSPQRDSGPDLGVEGVDHRVVLSPTRVTIVPINPSKPAPEPVAQSAVVPADPPPPVVAFAATRRSVAWLGLLPFFGYLFLLFLLPTGVLLWTSFQSSRTGAYTGANLSTSVHGAYLTGLENSVLLSLIDGALAAIVGLVLAQAIVTSRSPFFRRVVASASAILTNFGGLPLAFLFVAAIGNAGVLTSFLDKHVGLSLQSDLGFDLYSIAGIRIVYLYFLVPLMVLVIAPSLEGLRPQWLEAAQNLGATRWQYWRYVAAPVLAPSFFGAGALLFCASMSAYATADALTNGTAVLSPIQIGAILSGNVITGQENVGAALALDMMIVIVPLTLLYLAMQRRTTRWLQ